VRSASHATSLRHASVARMQSSRFLPGSVLVQVQPGARLRVRPTGEAAVFQAVPGEFDPHHPLDARAVQRLNAGPTRRRSLVRSQPRAPRRVLPEARNPVSHSGKHGFDSRTRYVLARLRLLMDQDLSLRISGRWFESTRSHPIGRDLGSRWFPKPISGVRFLDGLRPRQAAHLGVGSVSYAERAGFDPLACYRQGPRRADHLGVMAVLHTACAGFDPLARHDRFR
jgi:hypothetical protein